MFGKVYSRVVGRRHQLIVKPQIQENTHSVLTVEQLELFYLCRLARGIMGECPPSLHVVCGFETGLQYITRSPRGSFWGYCRSLGYSCYKPSGPHITKVKAVFIVSDSGQICS